MTMNVLAEKAWKLLPGICLIGFAFFMMINMGTHFALMKDPDEFMRVEVWLLVGISFVFTLVGLKMIANELTGSKTHEFRRDFFWGCVSILYGLVCAGDGVVAFYTVEDVTSWETLSLFLFPVLALMFIFMGVSNIIGLKEKNNKNSMEVSDGKNSD